MKAARADPPDGGGDGRGVAGLTEGGGSELTGRARGKWPTQITQNPHSASGV